MRRSKGFSFAEVMFAVVILGVGFIMVAAIFPVAAQQTRSTNDEAVAAQIARSAFQTIQSATSAEQYLADDNTHAYGDGDPNTGPWEKLRSSLIYAADKRYAWVPFYAKPKHGGPTHFTVVVLRRSLHDSYLPTDADTAGGELMPQNVSIDRVAIGDGGIAVAQITRSTNLLQTYNRIAPGAYLIVTTGDLAGRVLQIGELAAETTSSVLWKLVPGYGLNPNETCGNFTAAVIGKDLIDVNDQSIKLGQTALFGGGAQDISVFSAYLDPK